MFSGMKYFLTCLFILISSFIYAQRIPYLEYVESGAVFKTDQAIIYGSFIQRLGFSSGGYQQDIRIRNMDTNEVFAFEVKPYLRSRKENTFCFYIKPGTYEILNYWFTKSKWYGGLTTTEPIFKNIDANINLKNKIDSGIIKREDLHHFKFKVENNTITYVGQWHFDTGLVSFTDDKAALDKKLPADFYFLEFNTAVINIPQ